MAGQRSASGLAARPSRADATDATGDEAQTSIGRRVLAPRALDWWEALEYMKPNVLRSDSTKERK